MYERFTDRARKVMQLAVMEAQRFRHEYVGTEHLLLGLVAEGGGVAARVLARLGVSLVEIRRQIDAIAPCGEGEGRKVVVQLPHTPRAKKVIEYAIEESKDLNHNYVGTEHLLLGLLREGEGHAAQVLMDNGLKFPVVRAEVLKLLGQNTAMERGKAPNYPQADAFHIAMNLKPEAAETYPIAASPPPAALTEGQLQLIRQRLRHLTEQAEVFAAALDFTLAARCRDEADALRSLLGWYEWAHNGR